MKFTFLFTVLFVATGIFTLNAQTIVTTSSTNKNVVLEELTGKTCGYCPDGHKIAQQIYSANPGRIVLLNIHTGSYASGTPNYRSAWGDYVGSLFSVSGYPTGAVNRTDFGSGVMHSRGSWTSNANTTLSQSSVVNVGGNATIDLDTRGLVLDVEAYYTAAGPGSSNKFHAIITQNNIPGPQSGGATFNPTMILPNGDYNHMHMMRHNLSVNAGDNISSVSATSLHTDQYTYSVPTNYNNITVNLADLQVALFVTESSSTGAVLSGNEANMIFTTTTPLGASNSTATVIASLGTVCGSSADVEMQITNMGNTTLTTATFEYVVNGGTPGSYQHTFASALSTGQYETVMIPVTPLP